MRRLWLAGCVVGLGVGLACAQTPASQANDPQWKQTPEGRPAVPPTDMNCSGSATYGDHGKVTTNSNCPAAQDQPVPSNAAQQFPYPAESGTPKQTTPAPNAPDASQAPKSPAQQFPFPGEQPDASSSSSSSPGSGGVKPAPPGGLNDAGSSGSSSSSSSSSSGYSSSGADDAPALPDADDTSVPTRTRSSRRNVPGEPVKTPTQRVDEDLQVAGFYQNDGNFRGAYMRAKDAVSVSGDNPDARLALGDAARKLGKLDEAQQNYKKCLELDPVPKTKKAAEEALKAMTGGG